MADARRPPPPRSVLHDPHWGREHGVRRAVWQAMNRLGLTGLHALPMHRRWVDFERHAMPLRNLDPAMEGFTLVQISDLHYSPVVWKRYLSQYLHWVNDLKPDLVVVTGDLITGGYRYAERVARLLEALDAKHGVVCTFGNHDYSVHGKRSPAEAARRGAFLADALRKRGLIVLRNQVCEIARDGGVPLTIVGLDDEWSGHIDPDAAFAGVDPSRPILCLNHNPANARELLKYPWQWMLSGHTHGRAVATSKLGRRLMPGKFRHYVDGYYAVEGRHLYVNRGLSYGKRAKDWCRPEVTIFRLERAENSTEQAGV